MNDIKVNIETEEDTSSVEISYNYDGSVEIMAFDENDEMIEIVFAEIIRE